MVEPRRRAAWIVGLLLASACSPRVDAPAARRTDLVVLVVDGLRADRTDAAVAALSPWLGGDVLRFERAYAPSSLAEQSLAALFSGRRPTHGGGIGLVEAQPAPEAVTLATRLRRMGYRTGLVSDQTWAARPGFGRGFDALEAASDGEPRSPLAPAGLRLFDEEIATSPDGDRRPPFFLTVHWGAPAKGELGGAGEAPAPDVAARYDAAIAARLEDAADLLSGLEQRGALSHAAIVLVSGHGFELLEHGDLGTGFTLYEEVIRVPLLVRVPGARGGVVAAPVEAARLLATALVLAGGELDAGAAADELPPLPLADPNGAAGEPVIVELVVRERAIARAVIDGREKYLQVLRDAPLADRDTIAAGYEELQAAMASGAIPTPPLFGEPEREMLFRLRDDLAEDEIALAEHVETLARLRAKLRDYRRSCESSAFAPPEITERMEIDPNDVRELEAIGYM